MPKTFAQMVNEALAEVPTMTPEEVNQAIIADPMTFIVDVRAPADIYER